jgi:hypothetical protein
MPFVEERVRPKARPLGFARWVEPTQRASNVIGRQHPTLAFSVVLNHPNPLRHQHRFNPNAQAPKREP